MSTRFRPGSTAGERRLHQSDDFVAIEIAAALARDIRVIPVLVDGAIIPKASELPDFLKPLVRRQAIDVRQAHFGRDAEALIERLREVLGDKTGLGRWRARTLAGVGAIAALLLIGVGGYVFVGHIVEQGVQRTELKLQEERKAAEAEANRMAMVSQAEQERQAKAAQEAEAKRQADQAEQQRLAAIKAEQERQAKAAQDAEAKRQADEVEQQRLAAVKAEQERQAKAAQDAEAKRQVDEAKKLFPSFFNVGPSPEGATPAAQEEITIRSRSPFSGVKVANISSVLADELRLQNVEQGVVIVNVDIGSAAGNLGFLRGDVIQEVNGEHITKTRDLERVSGAGARNHLWALTILRGGQKISVSVRD